MLVTKRIRADLMHPMQGETIYAVQGDTYTRSLEIALYKEGEEWPVPEGASVLIYYWKPDGVRGIYDTLPNGDQAWSVQGNVVTVICSPQMLNVAGAVMMQIELSENGTRISTFPVQVVVSRTLAQGTVSEDYINWRSEFLPQPGDAAVGQLLQVGQVDEQGRVTRVETVGQENTQPDWSQNDDTQPDHVKNRTHSVEPGRSLLDVSFDGNIAGCQSIWPYFEGMGYYLCKVSDAVVSDEELLSCTICRRSGEVDEQLHIGVQPTKLSHIGENSAVMYNSGTIAAIVVRNPADMTKNYAWDGWQRGIYLTTIALRNIVFYRLYSDTVTVESELVHKLDNKYIDAEWMAKSEVRTADTIIWNGDPTGLEHISGVESGMQWLLVRVSEYVPTDDELKTARITQANTDETTVVRSVSEMWDEWVEEGWVAEDEVLLAGLGYVIKTEAAAKRHGVPGTGIYAYRIYNESINIWMFALTLPTVLTRVLKLPEKYLPDGLQRTGEDVILTSTTEGSTKKFKITVDDSGAISAQEVN